MEQYLINLFNEKNENYNEIINYLRRDEEDTSERYEPLFSLMDNYLENSKNGITFATKTSIFSPYIIKVWDQVRDDGRDNGRDKGRDDG